jgi:hypothetical protein
MTKTCKPYQVETVRVLMTLGLFFGLHTAAAISQADSGFNPDLQVEEMDEVALDQEAEQFTSDDVRAQQKEAKEQARLALVEKRDAQKKVVSLRERRVQIEQEARIKIAEQLQKRKVAQAEKARIEKEQQVLDREIAVIENRIRIAQTQAQEAQVAYEQARAQADSKRAHKQKLFQLEQQQKLKSAKQRDPASVYCKRSVQKRSQKPQYNYMVNTRRLPTTLPAKRNVASIRVSKGDAK